MSNFYVMKFAVHLVVQADSIEKAEAAIDEAWDQAQSFDVLDPQVRSIERIHCITELPEDWCGKRTPILGDGITRLEEMLPEVKEE